MKHEVITAVNESDAVEKGAGQLLTCLKSSVADICLRGSTGPCCCCDEQDLCEHRWDNSELVLCVRTLWRA